MRWSWAAIATCACACGRVGFDATIDADAEADASSPIVLVDVPAFTTCPPQLRLVGQAACDGAGLVLTPDAMGVSGAFWLDPPITIGVATKLFVEAKLQVTTMSGMTMGDGFAFVAHTDPAGASTIGNDGDGLGLASIAPSVAVSFDTFQNTWDPFVETIGVHFDGDAMVPAQTAASQVDMTNGTPFTIWVDHDEALHTLSASNSTGAKPVVPALTYSQPITNLGTPVWIGMTASTGILLAEHRVLALRIAIVP